MSQIFLISNLCHVLNVVCFLLGNSPASEFYMLMFWNTLSVPSLFEDGTECSETSAYKIQMSGNCPEESIQQKCPKSLYVHICMLHLMCRACGYIFFKWIVIVLSRRVIYYLNWIRNCYCQYSDISSLCITIIYEHKLFYNTVLLINCNNPTMN